MAKRSYKLGDRHNKYKDGQFHGNRWAFTQNYLGQYVILVDPPTETDLEAGHNIRIFHPIPSRPAQVMDLTKLTEEELLAMRQLFMDAFDWSLPIVRARDKAAADAFADGDDTYPRTYRQVPQLVYRSRPVPEHGEGVQHGHENVHAVESEPGDLDGGELRGPGDDVAQRDESVGEPEDDGPTPDEPEGLREVGGPRTPTLRLPPPHAGQGDSSPAP